MSIQPDTEMLAIQTMDTVQLYIAGILTVDEVLKRLKYNKINNQVSFHTEKALLYLRFVGRRIYE